MQSAVAAFRRERSGGLPELPGPLSLTTRFLHRLPPGQAVLAGTSSFRLDRLALYLSAEGPAAYFTPELGTPELGTPELGAEPSPELLRQLADDLLEEVLGCPSRPARPAGKWPGYLPYLEAAFALPANRARADRIYRRLMREAGTLWGTLCALRGYSWGESFVGRNIGIKGRWEGGRWHVGIVFLDHDGMHIGGVEHLWPRKMAQGMRTDQIFLLGRPQSGSTGSAGLLGEIYRVSPEAAGRGREELLRATFRAYRRTLRALRSNPNLRELLPDAFLRELGHWDAAVRHYLRRDPAGNGEWKGRVARSLARKGYRERRIRNFLEALTERGELLQVLAPLYEAKARSRS